jgi:hypothetical protein
MVVARAFVGTNPTDEPVTTGNFRLARDPTGIGGKANNFPLAISSIVNKTGRIKSYASVFLR